jgi:hypothetical protein
MEHPQPTSIVIPGIEGFLNKHLLPYGTTINGLIKTAGHLQTMLATALAAHNIEGSRPRGALNSEQPGATSTVAGGHWCSDALAPGKTADACNRYISGNIIARCCLLRSAKSTI